MEKQDERYVGVKGLYYRILRVSGGGDFISELKKYGINVLIDVRSSPYSSYYTQYDRENLERLLKASGIYYRNYARQFGARQEDRKYYVDGVLNFKLFTQSGQFAEGADKVDAAIKAGYQPALMCAEKNPAECHRAIMVGKKLSDEQHDVLHIIPGGELKSQAEVGNELLNLYFPDRDQYSLFVPDDRDEQELIEEAYAKQNLKIGFKLEDLR